MRILRLQCENVKKLTVVEITPQGHLVEISGKNGQGKTSVLDSIMYALDGASIPAEPIHRGAEKGAVVLELGGEKLELVVKRTFTKSGSYLTVTNAEGFEAKSPQRLLDTMMGAISLDPLAFMRSDRKKQYDTLRGLVKLDVDPAEITRLNDKDYTTRTELNRDVKKLRATADAMVIPEDLPVVRIDEMAIVDEIQSVGQFNLGLERERERRQNLIDNNRVSLDDAKKLRERAAKLIADADAIDRTVAASVQTMATMSAIAEPKDAATLRTVLADAKARNALIAKREEKTKLNTDADKIQRRADDCTEGMTARRKKLDDALAKASLPVEGLGFGDNVVTLNGLPLDQASDAEQLLCSTAIAAALSPKLRVLRIRDGSLLDSDHWKWLADFAEKNDLQVWAEVVDSSRPGAIILEDGHIKAKAEAAE